MLVLKVETAKLEEEVASLKQKRTVLASKMERLKGQMSLLQKYSDNLVTSSKSAGNEILASKDTFGTFLNG